MALNLAFSKHQLEKLNEAKTVYDSVIAKVPQAFGEQDRETGITYLNFAELLGSLKLFPEAEDYGRYE